VPEQDLAQSQLRCGRRAAAQAHAGVLRLLRLALLGSRSLAARAAGAHVSRRAVRGEGPRSAGTKHHPGEHRAGGYLSARRWTGELRAPVRPRLAAATRRRAARVEVAARGDAASARGCRSGAFEDVAAEAVE